MNSCPVRNPYDLGRQGEEKVVSFLSQNGFQILEKNWRTPYGEVDLVAMKGDTLCIVEVKTRREMPQDALSLISRHQFSRLKRAATWIWISERKRFRVFRCGLVVVTGCGIKWINLPLLYDQA